MQTIIHRWRYFCTVFSVCTIFLTEPRGIPGVTIKTHQGLPEIEDILGLVSENYSLCVVFDDLFQSFSRLQQNQMHDFVQLVTEYSRKREIGRLEKLLI